MKTRRILYTCLLAVVFYLFVPELDKRKIYGAEDTGMAWEKREAVPLAVISQAAVLLDGESGRVLFGKNEDLQLPMASTTKIMTCILALENAGLDDIVAVSEYAASMPDVQLHIRKGETYRMEDLLYSLMLESHNDTAVAIAEHVSGSVEAFADAMNQKAQELGCNSTFFVTPNGLDGVDTVTGQVHSTTAGDLARIMRYCVLQSPQKEKFLEITRASSRVFSDLESTRSFSCTNHNALLTSMPGAISGKTGFTNDAGYCYVGAVEREGKTFVVALLACGWPPYKTYKWQDMQKLISYGEQMYDYYEVLGNGVKVGPLAVANGVQHASEVKVCYPPERSLKILMREDENVTIRTTHAKCLQAPVDVGTQVGHVDYFVGETRVASYPIVTTDRVEIWNMEFCAKSLLKKFLFCYNSE